MSNVSQESSSESSAQKEQRQARDRSAHRLRREQQMRIRAQEKSHQASVHPLIANFHDTMSSITSSRCDTCFERFLNLLVSMQPNGINECNRCANDRHIMYPNCP